MRVIEQGGGYRMLLSASDTCKWAHRPTAQWPCSTLSGKRVQVVVDRGGIVDLAVNGRDGVDVDGVELDAIVSDNLPKNLRHLWPTWGRE